MTVKQKMPEYNLRDIYLRSGSANLADDFDPTIGEQQLRGEFRHKPMVANVKEIEPESKSGPDIHREFVVDFITRFEFRFQTPTVAKKGEGGMRDAALVEAVFVASYTRVTAGEPTEEELKSWANLQTLVHVWPYWREYCASSFMRMRLPGTLIPLLHVKQVESSSPQQPQLEEKAKAGKQRKTLTSKMKVTAKKAR